MALNLAFGDEGDGEPLLILHGLFGARGNWASHVKALTPHFRVITADLRNHGASPWADSMSYDDMADDLRALLDRLGLDTASVIGHSMGGKVAMALALAENERVSRLVVVDIAPVSYPPRLLSYAEAMAAIDPDQLKGRAEADKLLQKVVDDPSVRAFLLQNLRREEGRLRWRLNLEILIREMEAISGFPEKLRQEAYGGPTLFVAGGRSDHLTADHQQEIQRLFPNATARLLPSAGHWVHSEQPEAFMRALFAFLLER
ncbi:MAG: alpha/beta fold hydrolase [Kiloniellales bacterium]|nr:alpha/beta fold hydrolase [Kiloniellales bacterium]